ncbi:heterocyst-inhibiting protein PatX [Nostoc sp. C117]|uniref:heterocyst-inhibiting protein PatX n=1 Tax=Nostoc sp. C117 TaxID=3349875 RepID=UPI00370DC9CA
MRAAISLLVSSLVFGPLASNCQAMVNHLSSGKSVDDSAASPRVRGLSALTVPIPRAKRTFPENRLLCMPNWQQLLSAESEQNTDDAPRHRGSGRREVTQKFANIYAVV